MKDKRIVGQGRYLVVDENDQLMSIRHVADPLWKGTRIVICDPSRTKGQVFTQRNRSRAMVAIQNAAVLASVNSATPLRKSYRVVDRGLNKHEW